MGEFFLYSGSGMAINEIALDDLFPIYDASVYGIARNKTLSYSDSKSILVFSETGVNEHLSNFNNPHRVSFSQLGEMSYNSGTLSSTGFLANQYTYNPNYISYKTGDFTLSDSDNGKKILLSGVNFVIVPTGLSVGFTCNFSQEGTGTRFIANAQILSYANYKNLSGAFNSAFIWQKEPNVLRLDGKLSP